MEALDEVPAAQSVQDGRAHVRHDAHAGHHVRRVGQLDADLRQRRAQGPHAEGDDVHGATWGANQGARLRNDLGLTNDRPFL